MVDLGFDPRTVPVRPAATVMLVRDADGGPEVFMLRRTDAAVFAAGMYVFPGGRVDDVDGGAGMECWCDGRSDADASRVLGLPSGGLAYWVAAIRECFEEAGVLLARDRRTGHTVSFADAAVETRFSAYRRAVHGGHLGLAALCEHEDLVLTTASMGYVSHWITPVGSPRRFDARFFVVRAPQEQEPLHDDHETVDSLWVRPADALARFERGDLGMFPPTVASLRSLARFATADEAVGDARRGETVARPVTVAPKVRVDSEGEVLEVLLPDHPDYDRAPDYDVIG